MKGNLNIHTVLGLLLTITISPCFAIESNAPTTESSKYLQAVQELADNVLKYGWDIYGPKQVE